VSLGSRLVGSLLGSGVACTVPLSGAGWGPGPQIRCAQESTGAGAGVLAAEEASDAAVFGGVELLGVAATLTVELALFGSCAVFPSLG
jgi:hypothetical protein